MKHRHPLIFLLGMVLVGTVLAAPFETAGSNGYDVLAMGAGAEPLSLAGAYTAASGSAYALYWNPAGIASNNKTFFLADYMKYVLDMHRGMLAWVPGTSPVKKYCDVGVYLNYFTAGQFDAVNEGGEPVPAQNFSAGYYEGAVVLARALPEWMPGYAMAAGLTLKSAFEMISDYRSKALAADIGFQCVLPSNRVKFGFTARNLGTVFNDNGETVPLPQLYTAGLQFHSQSWPKSRFLVDLNIPRYGYYTLRVGCEYRLSRELYVRGGYRFLENEVRHWIDLLSNNDSEYIREDFNTFSAGLGIKLPKGLNVDVAFGFNKFQTVPFISSTLLYTLR